MHKVQSTGIRRDSSLHQDVSTKLATDDTGLQDQQLIKYPMVNMLTKQSPATSWEQDTTCQDIEKHTVTSHHSLTLQLSQHCTNSSHVNASHQGLHTDMKPQVQHSRN